MGAVVCADVDLSVKSISSENKYSTDQFTPQRFLVIIKVLGRFVVELRYFRRRYLSLKIATCIPPQ